MCWLATSTFSMTEIETITEPAIFCISHMIVCFIMQLGTITYPWSGLPHDAFNICLVCLYVRTMYSYIRQTSGIARPSQLPGLLEVITRAVSVFCFRMH